MTGALILAGAYLLGGVPFGYLLVRWKTGQITELEVPWHVAR